MSEPVATDVLIGDLPERLTVHEVARPEAVGSTPTVDVIAYPPGWSIHEINNEPTRSTPLRSRGVVVAENAEGFIVAAGRHLSAFGDSACLYAQLSDRHLVCVLNDDADGVAGWRDLRVQLRLTETVEWRQWKAGQGKKSQEQFADLLDLLRGDIVKPSAAEAVEIAETFTATIDAKFGEVSKVRSGARSVAWEEEISARAGNKGDLTIPDELVLGVVPFVGGRERIECHAPVSFAVREKKLSIGYRLDRPHEVEQAAFEGIVRAVAGALGLPLVYGSPAGER